MTEDYIQPPARAADLTPRQLAVARLIAHAQTDKQISAALGMNCRRVRVHIAAIAYRIHANPSLSTRVQIANWWRAETPDIRRDDAA